ncbi:MAG: hypothetical protein IPJ41_02700 [Phycisphaerales bacterium]|nr:hypothetical protein [Phycisphaerales bacterium]
MNCRNIIQISGLCAALCATGAVAQNETGRQPVSTTSAAPGDVSRIIQEQLGVWRVDVTLDQDYLWRMHASGVDQRYITMPGEDRDQRRRDTPSTTPKTKPDSAPSQQPWSAQPDKTPSTSQPSGVAPEGMVLLSGYAETEAVLDNTLRERLVFPDASNLSGSSPAGDDDHRGGAEHSDKPNRGHQPDSTSRTGQPGAAGRPTDRDGFGGISFIEFNPDGHTYEMAMLCNMSKGIQTQEGYFDAQDKRVVFRSSSNTIGDAAPGSDPHPTTSPDSSSRPSSRPTPSQPSSSQPGEVRPDHAWSSHGMSSLSDCIVVLEIVDDDTRRVTMYDGNRDAWQPEDSNNERGATGRDDQDHSGANRDPASRRQENASNPSGTRPIGDMGRVIYQATYTRVPTTQESRIRSMIDDQIVVAKR